MSTFITHFSEADVNIHNDNKTKKYYITDVDIRNTIF